MKTKIGMFTMLIIGLLAGVILSSTSTVFASSPKTITVQKTDVKLVINGKNTILQPIIVNDQTYLPLRIIAEVLNCDVDWDTDSKTVSVTKLTDN